MNFVLTGCRAVTYSAYMINKKQKQIIIETCSLLAKEYGKGGITESWKAIKADFVAWQKDNFGRALFASEIEDICK